MKTRQYLTEAEQQALDATCPQLLNSKVARSNHPADTHRFRASLINESRRILSASKSEGRSATKSELAAVDGIHKLIENVDLQLEADKLVQDGDGVTPATRIFTNQQKVARTRSDHELAGLTPGHFMKAMLLGTDDPALRNALSEGSDAGGGYSVPSVVTEGFIDALRAQSVCIKAGAGTAILNSMKTTIATIASDPVPAWRAENAAVTESAPTFGSVVLQARSLAVLVKVSRELVEDSINIEAMLQACLAGALAGELDRVALMGSGTAPEPRGIFNTSGIGSASMGTNGAVINSFDELVAAALAIASNNGAANGAVMAPREYFKLGAMQDATYQPLNRPRVLDDVPFHVTTAMPTTMTQGTSSVASAIIVGDWTKLVFGIRSDLRIELLRETFAGNLQYGFLAHLRADVAVTQPGLFHRTIGITPT